MKRVYSPSYNLRLRKFVDSIVAWGPPGLFVLATLDSAGIPLPGGVDALLILLSAASPAQAALCAGLAIVGSLIGCMVLYGLAKRGGDAYLARHTESERGKKVRAWFQHYGLLTVFISALSPVFMPTKLFVICAGALGVRPLPFFLTVLAARVPRYIALAYLGSQMGDHAGEYIKSHAWHIFGVLVLVFLLLFGAVKVVDARKAAAQAH